MRFCGKNFNHRFIYFYEIETDKNKEYYQDLSRINWIIVTEIQDQKTENIVWI